MSHTNVKSVRIVLLQLLPLRARVIAGQTNVSVSGVQALGQVHLGTFRCCDGQL